MLGIIDAKPAASSDTYVRGLELVMTHSHVEQFPFLHKLVKLFQGVFEVTV